MLRLARSLALPFAGIAGIAYLWHEIFHRAITHAVAVLDAAGKVMP